MTTSTPKILRLSDRILSALELALDQNDRAVAETLMRALELSMTRTGGSAFVERRDFPAAMEKAIQKLQALQSQAGNT